jgi:histidine ammonia-lyase
MTDPDAFVVDGRTLSCDDVVRVATGDVPVRVAPEAMAAAHLAWETASAASSARPVYGRTTGVGANKDAVVGTGGPGEHDLRLLRSHAAGVGELLEPAVVRAAMLIRLNQLAAGGSGIHPRFVTALETALRTGAVPTVHDGGSIGTGDLATLAEIALALTGHVPWARGAVRAVALEPGDALAFMSSNAVTLARAVLATDELSRLLGSAHTVTALSYCALAGSPEAFAEEVHARRPHPGSVRSAARLRELLWHEGDLSPGRRIQDPFGLRAFPQVHGPALDAVDRLRSTLEIEVNAAAENPLIDVVGGGVFHHGLFSTAYVALALDQVRAAVHHVAELSAARLGDLMEPEFTGLAPFLAAGPEGSSGLMILEYLTHDALGRLRHAAGPVTLGTSVISRGVEDHASFTPHAARSTAASAGSYRTVLACELVAAVRVLRLAGTAPRGRLLAARFADLDASLPDVREDHRVGDDVHAASVAIDRWGRSVQAGVSP